MTDENWFSPQLPEIIGPLTMTEHESASSRVCLWTDTFTFARGDARAQVIIGWHNPFHFRYQSNNYGINGRICDRETLIAMKDHILASDFANQRGLRDVYIDKVVSVTAKAPCSASMQPFVFAEDPREQVRRYIAALQALTIPPALA
jgi:hypothetical protein